MNLIEGSCAQDGDALHLSSGRLSEQPTRATPRLAVVFQGQTIIYEHHSSGSFDWVANWSMSPWDSSDGSFVFLRARSFTNWLLVFMMANSPPLWFVKSCYCWEGTLVRPGCQCRLLSLELWFLAAMWGALVQLGWYTGMSSQETILKSTVFSNMKVCREIQRSRGNLVIGYAARLWFLPCVGWNVCDPRCFP